jgi:serine/threonine protein kinase
MRKNSLNGKKFGESDSFDAPYKKGAVVGGEYEIQEVLGHGYFGVVYKAYLRDDRQVVAFKTLFNKHLEDPLATKLFKQECEIWIRLSPHPYIVEAYRVQLALQAKGYACYLEGDYQQALDYYINSTETEPTLISAWSSRIVLEDELGLNSDCINSCLWCLTIVPINYDPLFLDYVFQKLLKT